MRYSLLVEGLFRYNAHFVIMPFSLGSHRQCYNEVAVYKYIYYAWYRDSAGNIVEENSSVFSLIRMR